MFERLVGSIVVMNLVGTTKYFNEMVCMRDAKTPRGARTPRLILVGTLAPILCGCVALVVLKTNNVSWTS